jgi:hypothetical protein
MPVRRAVPAPGDPDRCFSKELSGENPPSFFALRSLYNLSTLLCAQQPWKLLDENRLVLLRSSAGNELCCCSVMGALGQVFAMHAYIGPEGLGIFRKMQAGEITGAADFYASQRAVYVEFVTRGELEKPDRELLAALGHPRGRAIRCPIFRAIRPGFYPWFVTAEEAQVLAECIRAVTCVCSALATGAGAEFWDEDRDIYPLVSHVSPGKSDYWVEPTKLVSPSPPPLVPVRLEEEILSQFRGKDYALRGVMELDHMFHAAAIGEKNERKALTCVVLAVDADTGMVYPPEVIISNMPPADAMARAFVKAVQSTGVFPREVRVRHENFRDCLLPLLQSFNVAIRVRHDLPALDEARAAMTAFLWPKEARIM